MEIISGRRLNRRDDLAVFLTADLEELRAGADQIRQALCGDRADLCTIINGRSGRCSEDCKFCAQSCHYGTQVEEYPFLPLEKIVAECRRNEAGGVHRFSIVTAGRSLKGMELEQALEAYARLHRESGLKLCASHGLQTEEEFRRMKEAGVERCHANLETSRRYFPQMCTTHTYEDKVTNIQRARAAGLEVCSGGILGMGESWEDRLDLAVSLAELEISSIPLNLLRPIPGTPYEGMEPISNEDVLRTVAFFPVHQPHRMDQDGGGPGAVPGRRSGAVPLWGQRGHHRGHAHHHRDQHGGGPGHAAGTGLPGMSDSGAGETPQTIRKGNQNYEPRTHDRRGGPEKSKIYGLSMTAVMAAVTCVLAPMSIPIGPVPISFTNLAIYLSLYLLGVEAGDSELSGLCADRHGGRAGVLRLHRRHGQAAGPHRGLYRGLHPHGTDRRRGH